MDIHKPKPWHGVREFLKEYLIIVVGVLTALAAEAVVQGLHEQRLSQEAREAVRAEINLDLANMKRRNLKEPCLQRRIAELDDFISKAEQGRPVATPLTIGGPGSQYAYTERWEAATAGGRLSLLSADEQRDIARVYAHLKRFNVGEEEENEAWSTLESLEGVQRPSAELLARARVALGRARQMDRRLRGALKQAQDRAAEIGIKGEDPHLIVPKLQEMDTMCLPISTPPQDRASAAAGSQG